ncbi:NUDIX hydrolase [Luteimonas wenzhouensis]|jgi:8-oxo-dGTP pyrophosphatase MutT (NUDIX family)|uniref:NUDIX hydrolase n=1 Tax=Luteimonas wenzhouensis TaxID=2599615 RepID=A0A5C5U778_9GAMM|nr:NUDIX hydrolase [Xanthomonadaceae bacterium]TWT21589.1 NUDIX hydrolase [Luteimonas wenzhouensis]
MRGLDRGGDAVDVDARARLARALSGFARRHPAQATEAAGFARLLEDRADPFVRERLEGHFTASAWLVDRTGSRTLLTHHRKLGRWLQPGGHADGDRDLARVALREAQEESGLHGLRVEPAIFDLDRHWIPEHRGVPGHWHYDVRYVVRAGDDEDFVVGEESLALAWRGIQAVAADAGADPSLRRMARRWLVERSPAPA